MNVVKAPDLQSAMRALGRAARAAADKLALADTDAKNHALQAMAEAIRANEARILEANAADLTDAKAKGLSAALLDRLMLDPKRI
ncbi:MAG TPA: gamma-glutamyl-phosphate reductase, partial [Dongiaceae bacterium]|nr:gamma-glutamyl-phosphate reductase [Dongiaceae bacterium]